VLVAVQVDELLAMDNRVSRHDFAAVFGIGLGALRGVDGRNSGFDEDFFLFVFGHF